MNPILNEIAKNFGVKLTTAKGYLKELADFKKLS